MSESLYTTQTPSSPNQSDGGAAGISTATTVRFTATGAVSGIRFFATTSVGGTYTAELWQVTAADTSPAGTLLASKVGGTPTGGTWNTITFDTPVSVATATLYRAVLNNSQGRYVALANLFGTFVQSGHVIGDSDADNPVGLGTLRQGTFRDNTGSGVYPALAGNKTSYLVDVVYDTGAVVTVALTPATVSVTAQPVTPVPGAVTVALTPAVATVTAVPVTIGPSAVTVALTPAVVTVTAVAMRLPGGRTLRPNTGTTTRPFTGITTRP